MMEEFTRLLDALRSDFDVLHNAFILLSLPDVTISMCREFLYQNNAFKVCPLTVLWFVLRAEQGFRSRYQNGFIRTAHRL